MVVNVEECRNENDLDNKIANERDKLDSEDEDWDWKEKETVSCPSHKAES